MGKVKLGQILIGLISIAPYVYGDVQPYNYPSTEPDPLKLCCSNTPDTSQSESIQYTNDGMKCPDGMTFYKVVYGNTGSNSKYIPTEMNCAPMKTNHCKWVPINSPCNLVNYSLVWNKNAIQPSYSSSSRGEDPSQYTIFVNGSWIAATVLPKSADQSMTYSYNFYILSNNIDDPAFCSVMNQSTIDTSISKGQGINCPETFSADKEYTLYMQVTATDTYQNNQTQKGELTIHLGNN
jgi:hypothetical protein